jgi:hypothetical protein
MKKGMECHIHSMPFFVVHQKVINFSVDVKRFKRNEKEISLTRRRRASERVDLLLKRNI